MSVFHELYSQQSGQAGAQQPRQSSVFHELYQTQGTQQQQPAQTQEPSLDRMNAAMTKVMQDRGEIDLGWNAIQRGAQGLGRSVAGLAQSVVNNPMLANPATAPLGMALDAMGANPVRNQGRGMSGSDVFFGNLDQVYREGLEGAQAPQGFKDLQAKHLKQSEAASQDFTKGGWKNWQWYYENGLEAAVQFIPQVAAGMASGGAGFAGLGAGQVFGSTYSEAYNDALRAGVDPQRANEMASAEAAVNGAVTYVTSKLPFDILQKIPGLNKATDSLVRNSLIRLARGGGGAAGEGAQEYIEGRVQSLLENARLMELGVGPYKTWDEVLAATVQNPEWYEQGVGEAVIGAMMGGPMSAAAPLQTQGPAQQFDPSQVQRYPTEATQAPQPAPEPVQPAPMQEPVQPVQTQPEPATPEILPREQLQQMHRDDVAKYAEEVLGLADVTGRKGALLDRIDALREPEIPEAVLDEEADPVPTREEFVAQAPKADANVDPPTVEKLAASVQNKKGKPGISQEPVYIPRTGETVSDSTQFVYRDENGEIVGILTYSEPMQAGDLSYPPLIQVAVKPEHQRKGIGSALYDAAEQAGIDVEAATGQGGYTEAGASLAHKRAMQKRKPKAQPNAQEAQAPTEAEAVQATAADPARGEQSPVAPRTMADEAGGATIEDLNTLKTLLENRKKKLGRLHKMDARRLRAVKAELKRREIDARGWRDMNDEQWLQATRFFRSQGMANAELPNGEKIILAEGNTAANFRENSRDFILGLRPGRQPKQSPVEKQPTRAGKEPWAMSKAEFRRHMSMRGGIDADVFRGGGSPSTAGQASNLIGMEVEHVSGIRGELVRLLNANPRSRKYTVVIKTDDGQIVRVPVSPSESLALTDTPNASTSDAVHRVAVKKAIREGKIDSHPDYPDLQPTRTDATAGRDATQAERDEARAKFQKSWQDQYGNRPETEKATTAIGENKADKTPAPELTREEAQQFAKMTDAELEEYNRRAVSRSDLLKLDKRQLRKLAEERGVEVGMQDTQEVMIEKLSEESQSRTPDEQLPDVPEGDFVPKVLTDESGNFNAEALAVAVARSTPARVSAEFIVDLPRFYSESLPDKIAREGGPFAKGFASTARRIVDETKRLYGSIAPVLDPALKAVGRMNRATRWLNTIHSDNQKWGYRNAALAAEDIITAPQFAAETMKALKDANLSIGEMAETTIAEFKASGKYQRIPTALLIDAIRSGRGPIWETLADAISSEPDNKMSRIDAVNHLKAMKAQMDENGPQALYRTIAQEHMRKIKRFPTDIKLYGVWTPILHADPFNYLTNAARLTTMRTAFRNHISDKHLTEIRKHVAAQMPNAEIFDETISALHGLPVDQPYRWVKPGSGLAQGIAGFNRIAGDFFSPLYLSASAIVNIPETAFGTTPELFGYKDTWKAYRQLKDLRPYLEEAGAINKAIYNWSIDPNAPTRSALRSFRNAVTTATGVRYINEFQEALAAATAHVKVGRMKGRQLSDAEKADAREVLRIMGFDDSQAQKMANGNAPDIWYDQFIRKTAAFMTGGNRQPGESSRFANSRTWTRFIPFQTYGMAKVNALRKVWSNQLDAVQSKDPQRIKSASKATARFMFGTTAQGVATYFLSALLYGGLDGLEQAGEEAKDEPVAFLLESMFAGISGPYYIAIKAFSRADSTNAGNVMVESTFPGSVAMEMGDYFSANGIYRNQSWFDRTSTFFTRRVPAGRILGTLAATVGLGDKNPGLDSAISGLYRWKRDQGEKPGSAGSFDDDQTFEFRRHMRKASEAIKRGQNPGEHLRAAMGVKSAQSAAASLRGKKILKLNGKQLTPEQVESLRKRIGDRAYQKLLQYDQMLEAWADLL